ncbi:hypothetical protein C474_19534 [Halogeometricum pallidum JCM 14848]|uniref:Uncharacterized protein n=1 Tax=Halogeometricum pallidum JCM 14848 TaxID=1227487 RepID=M0CXL6_HALPD|nr:hypothetical protein [Halogeometricum pallidum]ELZ26624.1 hypothetical protein C474_19534 [Halogeometricum pallidum JCM 14848]
MSWQEIRADDRITEWERSDGNATIRLRRRPDDTWAVRLDRLYQAEDGRGYRRERVDDESAARELVTAWREEHDVAE